MKKFMKLVNGIVLAWNNIVKKGKSVIVKAFVKGKALLLTYKENDINKVDATDQNIAANTFDGIKETSGTWRFNVGTSYEKKPASGKSEEKKKEYNPHVYFHVRRLKTGKLVYCHSKKLCEADPVGRALYAEWKKDPEAYMKNHPDRQRKK